MNASPFFDARGLCLCIQPVGHRVLAVAVGGAAGQGQRQGVFAGGQKPRQREFVRRPEGHARRLTIDSQLGHLLPGQGQQRRGSLQLRCCDLQCGAVGLGEMGCVLVRKGKVWCGQRQIGRRQGKGLAFPRSAGEQQQAAARGQLQRQAGPLGCTLGRAGAGLAVPQIVPAKRSVHRQGQSGLDGGAALVDQQPAGAPFLARHRAARHKNRPLQVVQHLQKDMPDGVQRRVQPQRQTDAHNLAQGSGIKAAGQNRQRKLCAAAANVKNAAYPRQKQCNRRGYRHATANTAFGAERCKARYMWVGAKQDNAHQQNAGACRTAQAFVQQLLQDTTPALDVLRANFK